MGRPWRIAVAELPAVGSLSTRAYLFDGTAWSAATDWIS